MTNTIQLCAPCYKKPVRDPRKSRAAKDLIARYADQNLKTDLDMLRQQAAILDWLEIEYPHDDDSWCGLSQRDLAKRWSRGVATVNRWIQNWEDAGLIVRASRKGTRRKFMKAGPNITQGLL